MPRSSSSSRRRARRRRTSGSPALATVFEILTNPVVIAGTLILGALLCVLAAGLGSIDLFSSQSWLAPQQSPHMARGVAILFAVGAVGAGGLFVHRSLAGSTKRLLPLVLLTLGLGASLLTANWLLNHRALPAGELLLAVNDEQESYRVRQGDREFSVMLPLRMTLRSIALDDEPTAQIVLGRPGQQGLTPRSFVPGQSLDVEGLRFTFAGISTRTKGYRGVLASDEPETIDAVAGPGEILSFGLDGPKYRLDEATQNYRDLLGPAVKLVDERGDSFWVFQRSSKNDEVPHGIRLKSLEEVPAAVMLVSSVRPEWPFMLGLGLLLLGMALFFFTHDMGVGRRPAVFLMAATAPVAALIATGVGLAGADLTMSATADGALTVLIAAGWILSLAALLGAGAQAELASPWGRGGLITAGLGALATTAAIATLGALRGRIGETGFGLPLSADGVPVMWGIDGAANMPSLALPVVAKGDMLLGLLAGIAAALVLALVATLRKKEKIALIGWSLAAVQGLSAALSLLGRQAIPAEAIATQTQKAMALQYLRAQNLSTAIAEQGGLLTKGEITVDGLAILPEIGALFFIALMSAVAAFLTWRGLASSSQEQREPATQRAPGLFGPAIIFGILAWALGLLLTLSQLGAAGILAPMEWVGLSAPVAALGFFILSAGDDGSPTGGALRLLTPALALSWLVFVWAVAAAAATLPGASVPFF